MALFLNKMFFGQRAYGVAAAAQVYFNKPLADVSVAEAATLAGVLPAPSRYNPVRSARNAEMRRGYVLGRMNDIGYIDQQQFDEAMAFPVESRMHGAAIELNAPYVAEMVRREMLSRYGEATYTDGYQVVTTLDSRMQRAANYSLRNGLLEYTRRRGYRGPLSQFELTDELLQTPFEDWPIEIQQTLEQYAPGGLTVALVTSIDEVSNDVTTITGDGTELIVPWSGSNWAKPFIDRETFGPPPESVAEVLAVGDVILIMPTSTGSWALAQVPEAQGAVVAIDPQDGSISSLAGGFDFATSKFNRATQASRQPGSSFKPFIYSAALEHGNTVATVVLDAPIVIGSSELEAVWRPINYSGRFYGPTRLRDAIVRSMNLVSVRLLLFETGFGNAINHIAKFGFGDAALIRNGSLALGGGNATPLDMVQGFAVFANGGYAVQPHIIDSIFGPEGEELYRADPPVVCRACDAEPDDDLIIEVDEDGNPVPEVPLEQMVDVVHDYKPDAATAPELFAGVNKAKRAISEQNAFLIQDLMRDVIRRGTGRRALVLGRRDLSGKTGTSNDQRDAWFGGFNADLATVVWVGYDDDLPLAPGEEGSRTALPIWIEYMRIALRGAPEHQLPQPEGIVSARIDRTTGCPARAGQPNTIWEFFREGHIPVCEDIVEPPDIFNDAGGIDRRDDEITDEEEAEPLF
jgi:penicillin-binding protein 1A